MAVTARPKLDAQRLRADFADLEELSNGKPLAYLDSASSTQKPRQVLDAMREFYEHSYANVHRGVYRHRRAGDGGLRGRAREGARVPQRAGGARDHLHARARPRRSTSSRTPGGSDNLGPGDVVVDHRARAPLELRPVAVHRATAPAPASSIIPIDDQGELAARRARRDRRVRERQGGREQPRLQLARNDQPGREARGVGARAGRDHGRRRGAGRCRTGRSTCRRSAATSSRSPRHKLCGPSGVGALWGRPELLEEMSAVPPRRRDDPLGRARPDDAGTSCRTSSRPARPRSPRRSASAPRSTT